MLHSRSVGGEEKDFVVRSPGARKKGLCRRWSRSWDLAAPHHARDREKTLAPGWWDNFRGPRDSLLQRVY